MIVSFLAAIEDGVEVERQATNRSSSGSVTEREGRVRAGLPSLLSLVGLDMSGRLAARTEDGESEEFTAIRRHTEASLFNLLRGRLMDSAIVKTINAPDELQEVSSGDLVEVAGTIAGNPLQELLVLYVNLAPLVGIDLQRILQGPQRGRQKPKQGGSAQPQTALDSDGEASIRLFFTLAGQMLDSSVRDLMLKTSGDLRAVLTLASEFLSDEALQYLLECDVRILAKVTRVLRDSTDTISLTRRSMLGLFDPDAMETMLSEATGALPDGVKAHIGDPIVSGPTLQLLPLAIFV